MSDSYRLSLIERLEMDHPGLKDFVDESLRRRLPQRQISRRVQERFGVEVPQPAISSYWSGRFRYQEAVARTSWQKAGDQYEVLKEQMLADPDSDAAEIVKRLVVQGIVNQKERLDEVDVMLLITEQRKRQELEHKIAIDWGKLQVQFQKLEHEKCQLAEKQDRVGALVREAVEAGAQGRPFDPGEALKKISQVIGVGAPMEERIESLNH